MCDCTQFFAEKQELAGGGIPAKEVVLHLVQAGLDLRFERSKRPRTKRVVCAVLRQWIRDQEGIYHFVAVEAEESILAGGDGKSAWRLIDILLMIEVLGHMIDKMSHWSNRVERILLEERPTLPGYDQDAEVREHGYQRADPVVLYEHLQQQCEHFADLVASLPSAALQREGVHGEYGPMTLQQCIEAPLESVKPHLEQLRAAQEASLSS